MIKNYRQIGKNGEQIALEYLFNEGYSFIDNNWQKIEGEIDLIVFDKLKEELVFVEVKVRNSLAYGYIEESISERKKIKLKNIIDRYICDNDYQGKYRFDFIGIVNNMHIIHYKNVEI